MTCSKLYDIQTKRVVWVQLWVDHKIMVTPFEWMTKERRWVAYCYKNYKKEFDKHWKAKESGTVPKEKLDKMWSEKVGGALTLLHQAKVAIGCPKCGLTGYDFQAYLDYYKKNGKFSNGDRIPCEVCDGYGINPKHATAQDERKVPPFNSRGMGIEDGT